MAATKSPARSKGPQTPWQKYAVFFNRFGSLDLKIKACPDYVPLEHKL